MITDTIICPYCKKKRNHLMMFIIYMDSPRACWDCTQRKAKAQRAMALGKPYNEKHLNIGRKEVANDTVHTDLS